MHAWLHAHRLKVLNGSATAKAIDTPRSNLYKKLEQYGLSKRGADGDPEAENPGGVAAE